MSEEKSLRIGIVGGGAAGLFTACMLCFFAKSSQTKADITILEKTGKVGSKLLLTGHGRCNITNHKSPMALKAGYHEADSFIYPALNSFSPDAVIKFFETELQCDLVEQENNRVFPKTEKSQTVLDAILKYISGVCIVTDFSCTNIEKTAEGIEVISKAQAKQTFDRVVLAMGGSSYSHTGSDGSSFKLASKMGHTISPIKAALSSVDVSENDRKITSKLSGLSVNADANLFYDNKKQMATSGDVLFTHKGLSGPAIYELSREIPLDISSREGWIELDFLPNRRDEEVDAELLKSINEKPDTKLINLTSSYVPSSLSQAIVEVSVKDCEFKRADVTEIYAKDTNRPLRKACATNLKHMKFALETAPNIDTAFVTSGGVKLTEINRKTMESKCMQGVYIIGEMLDIDGISGGYNLQAGLSESFVVSKDILS